MTTFQLVKRNLRFYWRTNLAVILGVATAVAVLAGALLVGDSVRASLRDLFLQRLGNTSYAITASGFFREQLAADIQSEKEFVENGFTGASPLIALEGTVSHEASKRRGSGIRVYGVDERFWRFHGLSPRDGVFASPALATELGIARGDVLLISDAADLAGAEGRADRLHHPGRRRDVFGRDPRQLAPAERQRKQAEKQAGESCHGSSGD